MLAGDSAFQDIADAGISYSKMLKKFLGKKMYPISLTKQLYGPD